MIGNTVAVLTPKAKMAIITGRVPYLKIEGKRKVILQVNTFRISKDKIELLYRNQVLAYLKLPPSFDPAKGGFTTIKGWKIQAKVKIS